MWSMIFTTSNTSLYPSISVAPKFNSGTLTISFNEWNNLSKKLVHLQSPLRIEFHMLLAVRSEWLNQAQTLPINLYIFDQNFNKFNDKWDATAGDGPVLVHKREMIYLYLYMNICIKMNMEKKCNAHKRRV